ncbi:MAG TPA: SDR family NAD(P)-dependent oxidoreductase [Usitatibacter sp.]|jgi:benzil reductase ((S)-benzoin forming)|nr:SDR family NAD(P)-dependent oxidoreductase [Usitatibacter sp.]
MNLYIVTGTTRGLGRALAERIARDPANELIALARSPDAPVPGGARLECDLADAAAVGRAFDRIEQRVRGKHYDKAVLVNNAGIVGPVGPLETCDAAALERNIAVNVVAPLLLMRRFIAALEGAAMLLRIVNISSGAGRRPIYGWSAYCTAKAALDMATRVVALEAQARRRPLEAVSLAPGVIDTDMQGEVRETTPGQFMDVERFRAMKSEGVLRQADDVAADILRLEAEGRLVGDTVLDLRELA